MLVVLVLAVGAGECLQHPPSHATPEHVYLTWQGDTSQTMTVNFHTDDPVVEPAVRYDTETHGGRLAHYAYRTAGTSIQIPGLRDGRYVHSVELTGLLPGTTHYFAIEEEDVEVAVEHKFATIADDGSPLRFICGGDMDITPLTGWLMEAAAAFDPSFALLGGDLAYANGELHNAYRWDVWLERWSSIMISSGGALIPIIAAVGNHEVDDDGAGPRAPFYFGSFPQGGRSYFSRAFGRDLVLFVLDSGHVQGHGGAQAEWLASELAAFGGARYKMAAYHVPLYPSHRAFDSAGSTLGREHWLPLFDQYGLDVAFEHHDHTHKRTHLLRDNETGSEGTLYLGDGCFGKGARYIADPDAWYLAAASGTPHFWVVDVREDDLEFRAVNAGGEVFDRFP